jgi:triacylglycerol lipase
MLDGRSTRCKLLVACALSLGACASPETNTDDTAATEQEFGSAPRMELDARGATGPTRYPIVLHHGFGGFPFHGVKEALEQDGNVVVVSDVPPFDSVDARSSVLARFIEIARDACKARSACDPSRVNVIAHSMGGLDARHVVSHLGWGDRVASLTTIGTPHRGTSVADAALTAAPAIADPMFDLFASLIGRQLSRSELAKDAHLRAAVEDLAGKNAEQFAREHPDDSRVYYQSWAGVSSVLGSPSDDDAIACEGHLLAYRGRRAHTNVAFWVSAPIVGGLSGQPNDGMIAVPSAKWGNFRGCVPADHGDLIGQFGHDDYDGWSGFDHHVFYRNIALDLAQRGF